MVWPPADDAEPHLPSGSGPERGLKSSFVSAMRIYGRPSTEKVKGRVRALSSFKCKHRYPRLRGKFRETDRFSRIFTQAMKDRLCFHQTCYYLYIPGSAPNCTLFEVKLGLCLINSDIPEIKHNVYFLSCHVTVCRTVYLTF